MKVNGEEVIRQKRLTCFKKSILNIKLAAGIKDGRLGLPMEICLIVKENLIRFRNDPNLSRLSHGRRDQATADVCPS